MQSFKNSILKLFGINFCGYQNTTLNYLHLTNQKSAVTGLNLLIHIARESLVIIQVNFVADFAMLTLFHL